MKEDMVITCREDMAGNSYFIVSYDNERGTGFVKYFSYTQLLKLLSNCYSEDKTYMSLGRIADGYIDSTICTDGSGIVRTYVPASPRVILLSISGMKFPKAFQIPMPPMFFEIHFGGRRFGGKCCVVKGSYEETREQYYRGKLVGYQYPFGNVNDSTEICMGNINYEVRTAMDAPKYINAFFDGITSEHYMKTSRVRNGKHQMEFLGFLEGREVFPYEELIELPEKVNTALCCPQSMQPYSRKN